MMMEKKLDHLEPTTLTSKVRFREYFLVTFVCVKKVKFSDKFQYFVCDLNKVLEAIANLQF